VELFKLRVQNLGRIKDAELSIRPLTVFVGPNNTNKTWTAYALYGLAQRLCSLQIAGEKLLSVTDSIEIDPQVRSVIETETTRYLDLVSSSTEATAVVDEIVRPQILKDVSCPVRLRATPNGLSRILAVAERDLPDASVTLELNKDQFATATWDRLLLRLQKSRPARFESSLTGKLAESFEFVLIRQLDDGLFARDHVKPAISRLVFQNLVNVVALPAERIALVTSYRSLGSTHLERLCLPVANFARMLEEAEATEFTKAASSFSEVVSLLEEKILAGRLGFEGSSESKRLVYVYDGRVSLGVHAAASLVRALAGLNTYLNHFARPGDLLIIDEPEMNAHPEAQLMIAEILAILVNAGIRIVVTTHSPYIVDHINNLTEAAELPESKQEEIATRFKLQTKEAFVSSENVATYLFNEDGRVTDVFDREDHLIDWSTFGSTSNLVSNLYADILDLTAGERR